MNSDCIKQNVILVNHVGFPPNAAKHCVIPSPPEKEFTIHQLKDTVWTQVFSGALVEGGNELEPGWVGDFSELKDDGIYQVRCGSLKSRTFTVYAGVYDTPLRILFGYFGLARCGHPSKGWAGACHHEDGMLVGHGPRDFSGGYHQSSDLRKWPWGLHLGLFGLMQLGARARPSWDDGAIDDELRWSSGYLQKLVREDGGLYDSVFVPIHWGPRDFYPSDPPAPALWNTIRHQSELASHFKESDATFARECLQIAERVWRYMTGEKRPKALYKPPAMPPLGHENLNTGFAGFYEGSALDLSGRLHAALAIHRLTANKEYLDDAATSATRLAALFVESGRGAQSPPLFWEGPEGERLASTVPGFGYYANPYILLGLAEALQSLPHHPAASTWQSVLRDAANWYLSCSRRNPWGLLATNFDFIDQAASQGEAQPEGFYPGPNVKGRSGRQRPVGHMYRRYLYHNETLQTALFLRRASELLGDPRYLAVAQRQLDWIMGCNPFDASAIEGVGYNQTLRGIFGEFFPPTPQLPGAVGIGLQYASFDPQLYGNCGSNEYDLPVVGSALWLMAEQAGWPPGERIKR